MNDSSSPPGTVKNWTTVRALRWLFRWRTVRGALIGLACVATLIGLVFVEENWRGKRAWENYRAEWEAKGERFDLASFVPKPVPPEQNFAMTPYFAPLFEYEYSGRPRSVKWKDTNALLRTQELTIFSGRAEKGINLALGNMERAELTDLGEWQRFYRDNTNFPSSTQAQEPARAVLLALKKFDPVLKELQEAARRPHAVFPAHYEDNFEVLLPHLAPLKGISQMLRLRAMAYLEAGQSAEAAADVRLSLYLAQALQPEPLLISHLVRIAILHVTLNSLWEGLVLHRWSEPQLVEFQKQLESLDLLRDYQWVLRGERAFANDFFGKMRQGQSRIQDVMSDDPDSRSLSSLTRFAPSGFLYQNQLCINRLGQERALTMIDPASRRVYPERADGAEDVPELKKISPYNILAGMFYPAIAKSAMKAARCQSSLDLTSVACALERFRMANKRYPDSLTALMPQYLAKIPHDLIGGGVLIYRVESPDRFRLYSVGWNGTDDDGEVAMTKGKTPAPDPRRGDWVWRFPEP